MAEACCTCATLLANIAPIYDEKTEKPAAQDRRLDCCRRVICGPCIHKNARFGTYCPFCQISSIPTPLSQSSQDPPSYTPSRTFLAFSSTSATNDDDELPSYTSLAPPHIPPVPNEKPALAQDVLHFLSHPHDTISSLSLRYAVPATALRRANNLSSDHLLLARRTLLIPGEYYAAGVSLSPRPVEGEEEEARKGKIRRWMVACKVPEYDVALLYLEQGDYDLDAAIEAYKDDEKWEKEHPLEESTKGKGRTRCDLGRRRYTGQRP